MVCSQTKMTYISNNEFETFNWLPVEDRLSQSINSIAFKYLLNNDQVI